MISFYSRDVWENHFVRIWILKLAEGDLVERIYTLVTMLKMMYSQPMPELYFTTAETITSPILKAV
jgi:hypothetical protein